MQAIMKTIKPKTCANIMNLIQSILVIKNKKEATVIQKLIDENGYADIYVYCSKDEKIKLVHSIGYYYVDKRKVGKLAENNLNDKVVFKFRCYKVEEIKRKYIYNEYACVVSKEWRETNTCNQEELSKKTCLTKDELFKCLGTRFTAYAIHISNLEIFDEPKEISEFYGLPKKLNTTYDSEMVSINLTNAPRNFCYVEVD